MSTTTQIERWRRVYVLGLGLSGSAAARLLLRRRIEVIASDRRPAESLALTGLTGTPEIELRLGRDDDQLPSGLDALIASPGVARDHPLLRAARQSGLPVLAEVELAFQLLDGTVIAVTGSNGKSTTTALAGALIAASGLSVEVCGNIGLPLSSVVEGEAGRIFVVELSSFQLETIDTFRPRAAALLNLAADHLDRHGDFERYVEAKRRLFRNQSAFDLAVFNADDPEVAATATAGRRRLFSRRGPVEDGCFVDGEVVVERAPGAADRPLLRLADLPLPGPHNLENAMAAALLARAVGVEIDSVAAGLVGFRGLPHRLEQVGENDGVTYFDDSKGTNVAATVRSLESFEDGTVHVILGGRGKGAEFAPLRAIVERKARRAYLIGESAEELGRVLEGATELSTSASLAAAVDEASTRAESGEVVLLSPACASFDQFRDFVDRGRSFRRAVEERLRGVTNRGGSGGQEARV
jgi:UDP-N-acetylmuramoylalanine--D-glutamate ligase